MSINEKKGNTTQWDRNDEIADCSIPENAPAIKTQSRETVFCRNVTIKGDLVVSGNVTIEGTLTVSGTIKAPYFDGLAKEATTAKAIG